jgi:hypothetical protein
MALEADYPSVVRKRIRELNSESASILAYGKDRECKMDVMSTYAKNRVFAIPVLKNECQKSWGRSGRSADPA